MTARRRSLHSQRGFTLIEVVVSMTIMMMALVSLLGVVQMGVRAAMQRRNMELSQMLINRVIAQVDARYEKPLDNEFERGNFGNEFPDFQWEYRMTANQNLENFKALLPEIPITIFAVEAKVIWFEDGEQRDYTVKTVKGWVEASKQ